MTRWMDETIWHKSQFSPTSFLPRSAPSKHQMPPSHHTPPSPPPSSPPPPKTKWHLQKRESLSL